MDFVLHRLPDRLKEAPDLLSLAELYVLHQIHITEGAELLDLGKRVLHVDVLVIGLDAATLDHYISAADALETLSGNFIAFSECNQIQGVGMLDALRVLFREHDLYGLGRKGIDQNPVGSVALTCLGKASVQDGLEAVCLGMLFHEDACSKGRTHGVGA